MTYTVGRVHSWNSRKKHPNLRRNWAGEVTVHTRTKSLSEALTLCKSLNSGHKHQSYWVLDETGKVIPRMTNDNFESKNENATL